MRRSRSGSLKTLSPTVFRHKSYRFFFFSREEKRIHVHVTCPQGEAKFWLEPSIELAENYSIKERQLKEIANVIKVHEKEILQAWRKHFGA
ncbi:MAG TPA: DUF4160 domain-containing protein [bacterium]|nr:DUF4160 domain-containing protein [bacterium]